ncbi:hypothetical protein KL86PLE_40713 [uncultured Pleomorphomonas sp.]|uniref:Uncharacterized protein n=1 Tax=uncultured Pleomorphomonas sp. TaxID=442121 RepID=A0A212LHD2_9HYPH|nr:hypothetical protein KL86PLE_40713 [uncultured Pleomorphomonas sp.]
MSASAGNFVLPRCRPIDAIIPPGRPDGRVTSSLHRSVPATAIRLGGRKGKIRPLQAPTQRLTFPLCGKDAPSGSRPPFWQRETRDGDAHSSGLARLGARTLAGALARPDGQDRAGAPARLEPSGPRRLARRGRQGDRTASQSHPGRTQPRRHPDRPPGQPLSRAADRRRAAGGAGRRRQPGGRPARPRLLRADSDRTVRLPGHRRRQPQRSLDAGRPRPHPRPHVGSRICRCRPRRPYQRRHRPRRLAGRTAAARPPDERGAAPVAGARQRFLRRRGAQGDFPAGRRRELKMRGGGDLKNTKSVAYPVDMLEWPPDAGAAADLRGACP